MKMWTMKEKELLKKHYKQVSMEELLTLLPGRTENSIYKQVNYLRKKGWIIRKRTDHGN
jgi:biotin operon repressor